MKLSEFIRSIPLRIEIMRAKQAARARRRAQRAVNAALADWDAAGERAKEFLRRIEAENRQEQNQ